MIISLDFVVLMLNVMVLLLRILLVSRWWVRVLLTAARTSCPSGCVLHIGLKFADVS